MKNSILTALLAGMAAALLLTLLQHVSTTPRILQAEAYERLAAPAPQNDHGHDHHHEHGHDHDHGEAWSPDNGWQRTLSTAGANLVLACGFALLLTAAFQLRPPAAPWSGLVWGLAGYVIFYLAPSLGLPAALPGAEIAGLPYRQEWWLVTVLATAVGLALLMWADRPWKLVGTALLLLPHIVGAPHAQQQVTSVPEAMITRFIIDTAWVNAAFWLMLGWLSAVLFRATSNNVRRDIQHDRDIVA